MANLDGTPSDPGWDLQVRKNSLNIKFLGAMFLGHPGPRCRDIPDKNFMQVAFFCCFKQGVAGMVLGFGVGTSQIWKNFMQENFGLIFRTLDLDGPGIEPRQRSGWHPQRQ